MRGTRIYQTFYGMRKRCTSPKDKRWERYGGRGIKCEWPDFESFRDDMYQSYLEHVAKFGEKETQIDRYPNPDGNYNKENCRWATFSEQSKNRSDRKQITFGGKTQYITDWCKELNLPIHLVWLRIYRYGWEVEKALTEPKGPTSKRYGNKKRIGR